MPLVTFRLDVTMLEPVVHDDEVDLGMLGTNPPDGLGPLLADDDDRIGKLELDLERLVADLAVMRRKRNLAVTLGFTPVPAREERDIMLLGHVGDNHLGHRGLAGTADGDVADADDGDVEPLAFEEAPVEKAVTECHPHLVEKGYRSKQRFRHGNQPQVYGIPKDNEIFRPSKIKREKPRIRGKTRPTERPSRTTGRA